ncbi:MAG: PQQ-dependent sugar dehydrogenase [Nitrosarchaeum sp.]
MIKILFFIIGIYFTIFVSNVSAQEFLELDIKVETVAENLKIPWEIDFAPDGRIFFTERVGNLRMIENGLVSDPIISLSVSGSEGGLLGLALDPNFEENHYLYLYYSYNDFFNIYNKVVRYTESNNTLSNEKILLDKIPGSQIHDGGRIKFGPDGKLYITTGDAANSKSAQNLDSLSGKILRINSDGTIPKDNPFTNSAVFSYGHRNPQGIDWHPVSKILVATEHGPSGERGNAHDEINIISVGKNYGWHDIVGDEIKKNLENPILHTGKETWAPSGSVFYDSNKISEWFGKYFIATLRGNHLRILDLDLENNLVISSRTMLVEEYGRLRSVDIGPDGYLYILTSNQDGRGQPANNDDRILRVILLEQNLEKGDSSRSPLKQIHRGILPQNVSCKEGLELIFKNMLRSGCVKSDSIIKLVERGWIKN